MYGCDVLLARGGVEELEVDEATLLQLLHELHHVPLRQPQARPPILRAQEMFDGMTREVVEETGVPASSLTDPVFIGVSRREINVRPTAFFFTKCSIDSSGVTELYSRAQDGYESTKLFAVSADELRGMSQRIPGCHHGSFVLYELMRNSAENL